MKDNNDRCDCDVCSDPNKGVCASGFSILVDKLNEGQTE